VASGSIGSEGGKSALRVPAREERRSDTMGSLMASLMREPLNPTKPTPDITMMRDIHLRKKDVSKNLEEKTLKTKLVEPKAATEKYHAEDPDE